jgi:hypothetical protein
VDVRVTIPRNLTPRQQELLQDWVKDEPEGQAGPQKAAPPQNPGQEQEGFFKKLWHSWINPGRK